jgi:hypothetical protein
MTDLDVVASTIPPGGCRPLADPVHRDDGGLLEWGREERACGVGLVVLGIHVPSPGTDTEARVELTGQEELLAEPDRQRLAEGLEARRREGQVGLEETLELRERLLIEAYEVELLGRDAGDLEAVADRVGREALVVLLTREAFFLGRRHHTAVGDERGRAVVIEGGDAEDVHFFPVPMPTRSPDKQAILLASRLDGKGIWGCPCARPGGGFDRREGGVFLDQALVLAELWRRPTLELAKWDELLASGRRLPGFAGADANRNASLLGWQLGSYTQQFPWCAHDLSRCSARALRRLVAAAQRRLGDPLRALRAARRRGPRGRLPIGTRGAPARLG